MIELGQTVGNYRITAKLGEGGMGTVYLAEHPVLGRKAALKIIHPRHARNAEVIARFVDEATAISRIGHPNIVDVTDLGRTSDGDLYFVMEYLDGPTLSDAIAREAPMPLLGALAIAVQIADALTASHAHGVVHRDVKPDNVVLVARGGDPTFVKVLDFGLAKLARGADHDAAARISRPGIVMGSPCYMSPEQCRGDLDVDARADVYALGVVLFEMLTGAPPFAGDGSKDVLLKQVALRAPAARSRVPELPEALDDVLARALAKKPADRFATMAAFRDVLRGCAGRFARARRAAPGAPPRLRALVPALTGRRPTTLGQATGALEAVGAPARARPRRGAVVALAGAAALAGTIFAAGLTRGSTARALGAATAARIAAPPARASTLLVTFGAAPDGGAPDGAATPLGATLETRFQELR
jgi:serine/threonine-protein kinase